MSPAVFGLNEVFTRPGSLVNVTARHHALPATELGGEWMRLATTLLPLSVWGRWLRSVNKRSTGSCPDIASMHCHLRAPNFLYLGS
jgi:hypothetical protein